MYIETHFSEAILVAVLVLISARQIGKLKLQIWQIMLGGALAVVLTGQISLYNAARAIIVFNITDLIYHAGIEGSTFGHKRDLRPSQ